VTADHDRLRPVRHDTRDILADDRLAENRTADDIAQRTVRRLVHPPEVEFLDARLVGRDAGAFDPDAVLQDRVGGIDRNLVVAGLPLGGSA
jgi:hypothetical protein